MFKVIDMCVFFRCLLLLFSDFLFFVLFFVVFFFGGAQLNAYVVCILLIGKCFESSVILYVI